MKALLLLAVSAALAAQTPIEAKTILVIGDSISAGYGIQRNQGWVALLEARVAALQPPYTVVNASISGDTTGGALARLPRTLEIHKPDVVVIELGGNDALRGYPVDRIESNLDAMASARERRGRFSARARHGDSAELRRALHAGVPRGLCGRGEAHRRRRWCRSCWTA